MDILEWVRKQQEALPSGNIRLRVSHSKTDYLSGDPGEWQQGSQEGNLSFDNGCCEASFFEGAVRVRLSPTVGVEATAFADETWKVVRTDMHAVFWDNNPTGGDNYYVAIVS